MTMNQLLLVVDIAGEKVALRAADVQSVIELESLMAVPRAPQHVAGLSALRSRLLTVIDCQCALGLGQSDNRKGGAVAAVVMHDNHAYALLLDRVQDVTEAWSEPLPVSAGMDDGWSRMSSGMVETEMGPLLLIEVAAMISGLEEARAA
jgi:purine-binding chemotaxis protein CheW